MANKNTKVSKLFDPKRMQDMFSRTDFSTLGFKRIKTANNRFYWFKDNGAKILAVAHLDSVRTDSKLHMITVGDATRVYSPVLDDRLGVYIVADLLPRVGVKSDILLTTDEEIGMSSGSYFETEKQYNWMFQFDRSGNDVVMYQYDDKDSRKILTDCGWTVGHGSYSDICDLEHLNCKGFNFGTAYYEYHTDFAYAKLDDLVVNLSKFYTFYKKMNTVALPHDSFDWLDSKKIQKNDHHRDFSWDTLGDKKKNVAKKGRHYNAYREYEDEYGEIDQYDCRYCGSEVVMPKRYMMSYEHDMAKDECCWTCYQHLMGL